MPRQVSPLSPRPPRPRGRRVGLCASWSNVAPPFRSSHVWRRSWRKCVESAREKSFRRVSRGDL
eukprot:6870886-Pyramimonas_sp.AAC.1